MASLYVEDLLLRFIYIYIYMLWVYFRVCPKTSDRALLTLNTYEYSHRCNSSRSDDQLFPKKKKQKTQRPARLLGPVENKLAWIHVGVWEIKKWTLVVTKAWEIQATPLLLKRSVSFLKTDSLSLDEGGLGSHPALPRMSHQILAILSTPGHLSVHSPVPWQV